MPKNPAVPPVHHYVGQKVYIHKKSMDDGEEDSIMVIPSASNILVDDAAQASSESIMAADNDNQRVLVANPKHRHRHARSCLPEIVLRPPELIRGTILNKGESYWKTTVKAAAILATASLIELLIYFFVFCLMGHFRIILALLPVRNTVVAWFLVMFGADMFVIIVVKLGKCVSTKFESTKRVDMYCILVATIVLIFSFLISIGYPVYAIPHLMTRVRGTIIQNDTYCMPARDSFQQQGSAWGVVPKLREICKKHILCVENCRDFRDMHLWFYGTYLLTVIRLLVLITLWDVCGFLCMVMDLREENITYTINLPGGYHM